MIYKLLLTIVYFGLVKCQHNSNSYNKNTDQSNKFPVFHDLNTILEAINAQRGQYPELVDDILDTYYNICTFAEDVGVPEGNRRTFIVIEGNDRNRREMVVRGLAERIRARLIRIPPKCLTGFIVQIPTGTALRRAFFALSLYVAAYNVRQLWILDNPIILNGYWTDQTSFILGKKYVSVGNLPPETSEIYQPPADLMAPDIIFYLHYPHGQATFAHHDPNKKPLIWNIYNRFRNPKPFIIDTATSDSTVVTQLWQYLNKHLSHKSDLSYTTPNNYDKV